MFGVTEEGFKINLQYTLLLLIPWDVGRKKADPGNLQYTLLLLIQMDQIL